MNLYDPNPAVDQLIYKIAMTRIGNTAPKTQKYSFAITLRTIEEFERIPIPDDPILKFQVEFLGLKAIPKNYVDPVTRLEMWCKDNEVVCCVDLEQQLVYLHWFVRGVFAMVEPRKDWLR